MNTARKLIRTEEDGIIRLRVPARKAKSVRSKTTLPQEYLDTNERIKHVRLSMGLTQKEFAQRLSENEFMVTESYIKAMETGRVAPKIFVFTQLKRKMGVPLDWSLMGEGEYLNLYQ